VPLFVAKIDKPLCIAKSMELLRIWADRIQHDYDYLVTVLIPLPTLYPKAELDPQQRSEAEYRLYAIMPKVRVFFFIFRSMPVNFDEVRIIMDDIHNDISCSLSI